MMTSKEKRDFIASEIAKRIIGPGYTEGVFSCKEDASDEILDNRPIVVYSSGILYPKKSDTIDDITPKDDNDDVIDNTITIDDQDDIADQDDNNTSHRIDKKSNELNLGIADRADFKPSHIGIIACVDNTAKDVQINVKYGIYHSLGADDISDNVKVKLGRCSLEQLKSTFKYYDQNKTLLDEIKRFGANNMNDLFLIDETNFTISPRRIFVRKVDGKKPEYLKSTSFPDLPRNKVAKMLIELFKNPANEQKLPINLDWDTTVKSEIINIEKTASINPLLDTNNWNKIIDNLTYSPEKNTVRITNGQFKVPDGTNLYDILYVDDPVKAHLLPLLLQFRYFKREQKNLSYTLSLDNLCGNCKLQESDDRLKLHWKIMERTDHLGQQRKYIQVLLENAKESTFNNNRIEDYIHQAELKISSPRIISYSEPHRSSIADNEYDVNEILYSDIKTYAKGVNCGAKWNITNDIKEVMTTYTPSQLAAAFNPESDDSAIQNACDVFDLTIWSKLSKEDMLARFKSLADSYKIWHQQQTESANGVDALKNILSEQNDFLERLNENIDYLRENDNAYKCFQIANTAMYIQMVISRDPYFKKNRNLAEFNGNDKFGNDLWDRFMNGKARPKYRPFQLAFLLMNVKSTFENDDKYRNDNVDLIWFPTGGGKTEAYLALTALTIAHRRMSAPDDNGISVIMRYTLRLLTAQQFERASFLICALEFLRQHIIDQDNNLNQSYNLGNTPITIGMWIGKSSSPNEYRELNINDSRYAKFRRYLTGIENNSSSKNPFPISYCPWCGCKMVAPEDNNSHRHGYDRLYGKNNRHVHCINDNCCFKGNLPIMFIDEEIYQNPPTILFATVDKFAKLKDEQTGKLFGCRINDRRKPDLIIQDELHLISGPLGSLVGLYETMVEEVCTERNDNGDIIRRPKIIASTATTRNTQNLIKQLYTRKVRAFPVSGVKYSDNFFSKVLEESECKRMYMGLAPTGHSASELEIRAIAAQIVAKEKLIATELKSAKIDLQDRKAVADFIIDNNSLKADFDDYWTLVLYYNNLKSLGRTHSRIGQEIKANAEAMREYLEAYPSLDFIGDKFNLRTEEFTSRQESSRIKELLVEAEARTLIESDENNRVRVRSKMDIVQATNMISVGIDISRWNTMMIVGQPLTTAEYIQSSSRVARATDGLAINLYNPLQIRELSLYENYVPYHSAFYKHVEPLMVTTFTEQTIDKLLANIFLCYMVTIKGYKLNKDIKDADIKALISLLTTRSNGTSPGTHHGNIDDIIIEKLNDIKGILYNNPHSRISDLFDNNSDYKTMNSLRDIEADTYIYYNI